ncbi:MAG: DUF4398 domain-containing protein [Mariprofundaceae bacterium]
MRFLFAFVLTLLMVGCAMKPPVQEMAEARAAVAAARELPDKGGSSEIMDKAESSLKDAVSAMDENHYERARRKALEAKREAQRAARIKQQAE